VARPVHVLLASHRYYPVPGGTERVVQSIAEGLVRRGHRATVLTQAEPGSPEVEQLNGVEVRRLFVRRVAGIRWPRAYLSTLRAIDADLFHLHGNRIWCADFYFPFARRFHWPQVLTGYGFYQWEMHPRLRDRLYFRRYFPWVVRAFDAYTPMTERERAQLLGWGVSPDRLTLVPAGIELEEFAHPPDGVAEVRRSWGVHRPYVAVYAGGFFENKRVDRLVEALGAVRDRWALVAIGRDVPGTRSDLESCRSRASELGVEFVAPGVLPRMDVLRSLFASDAVVLGSEYEGYGLLPLEAMAAGRPFVAFESGAARELAATGAGSTVDDVPAFGRALAELADPEERRRRGAAGQLAVRSYSVDAMVDRFVAVYGTARQRREAVA